MKSSKLILTTLFLAAVTFSTTSQADQSAQVGKCKLEDLLANKNQLVEVANDVESAFTSNIASNPYSEIDIRKLQKLVPNAKFSTQDMAKFS